MADLSGKLAKSTRTAAPKKKVADTFTTATDKPTRTTVYFPAGLAKRLKHAAIEDGAQRLGDLGRPRGRLARQEGSVIMFACRNMRHTNIRTF